MQHTDDYQRFKHRPFAELVRLAWPIAVSMLSYSLMTLVDTLFVGRLGSAALAGVGLGGVAAFTLICFGIGLLRGTKVLVSQALGAGQRSRVPPLVGAALLVAALFGVAAMLGGQLLARVLPDVASSDAAGQLAAEYVAIRLFGAPLFLAAVALREVRYGLGDTRAPMRAALIANLSNIPLDALLIFGLDLGVPGAAWATVIAQGLEAGLLFGIQGRKQLGLGLVRWRHLVDTWRVGAPIGVEFFLNVGAFSALVILIARMGEIDLAAHQIALQACHFSFLPAMAVGEAASVLSGRAVGAGDDEMVHVVGRKSLLLASGYTGLCALVFLAGARPITALFTPDPAVQLAAVHLFWVAAAFQLFDGAYMIGRGVLRGTGDVRFAATATVLLAWGLAPPLAWLLGLHLGWGAVGAWLGLLVELGIGGAVMWLRLTRGGWHPAAHASRARLVAEQGVALQPATG